jgi:hypothetical protein
MPYSGMLRCVALVRTEVSEERRASIIRVKRISELGTALAVTSNRCMLWFLQGPHGVTSQKTAFFISSLCWLIGFFKMPYGPTPCISYACCQSPKSWLHHRLPFDSPHRHVGLTRNFLENFISNYAYAHEATQLVACQFHQCAPMPKRKVMMIPNNIIYVQT